MLLSSSFDRAYSRFRKIFERLDGVRFNIYEARWEKLIRLCFEITEKKNLKIFRSDFKPSDRINAVRKIHLLVVRIRCCSVHSGQGRVRWL